MHLPLWTITALAGLLAPINRSASGFLKFFAIAAGIEQVGTAVGTHSLEDFYAALAQPTPIKARVSWHISSLAEVVKLIRARAGTGLVPQAFWVDAGDLDLPV
ncbi:MAG: hypothetical protein WBG36_08220 [Ornithinimicrobium sp.]